MDAAMRAARPKSLSGTPFADTWAAIEALADASQAAHTMPMKCGLTLVMCAASEATVRVDLRASASLEEVCAEAFNAMTADEAMADEAEDELERLCEQARQLGLMDEAGYDSLTDAVASGALVERDAIERVRSALGDASSAASPEVAAVTAAAPPPPLMPPTPLTPPPLARRTPSTIAIVLDVYYLQVRSGRARSGQVRSGRVSTSRAQLSLQRPPASRSRCAC